MNICQVLNQIKNKAILLLKEKGQFKQYSLININVLKLLLK